jgi:hypothetical protein
MRVLCLPMNLSSKRPHRCCNISDAFGPNKAAAMNATPKPNHNMNHNKLSSAAVEGVVVC